MADERPKVRSFGDMLRLGREYPCPKCKGKRVPCDVCKGYRVDPRYVDLPDDEGEESD